MSSSHGFFENLTVFLIFVSGIYLVITFGSLLIQFRRLHANFKHLLDPLKKHLKAGSLQPEGMFAGETADKNLGAITQAVKEKLADQGILDVIRILSHSLHFLNRPIRHQTRNLRWAGIGIMLMGFIGTIFGFLHTFEGYETAGTSEFRFAIYGFSDALIILVSSLIVGLLCLTVSSFFTRKLEKLQGILSPETFTQIRKKQ
jgi:biopolymer transport protein ExbB/TolQ